MSNNAQNLLFELASVAEKKRMTIYKLSKLSGVSYATVKSLFSGTSYPRIDILFKICKVLNVELRIKK